MGSIDYTALRSLDAGVNLNDPITRDLGIREATYRFNTIGNREVALDGTEENSFERIDEFWAVVTAVHTTAEQAELLQFVHSVANGEEFDIDFEGTLAAPDVVRTVRMVSRSLTETRIVKGGFRYSFSVKLS